MSTRPHVHSFVVGFRVSAQGFTKPNTLAKRTGRTRAAVLRYLIDLAEATNLPDIRFQSNAASVLRPPQ
jgi:predicted DNA-binding protein